MIVRPYLYTTSYLGYVYIEIGLTTWVHTTELYSTDVRSTAHTLAFIVGRFGGFASGYVVENANSIPFATTVLIIMAALSALGTLTLRETMGERLS